MLFEHVICTAISYSVRADNKNGVKPMSEAKIIVFPTDFSDASLAAIPWVKRLAAVLDADVHCICVVEEPHIIGPYGVGTISIPSGEELAENTRPHLDEFAAKHFGEMSSSSLARVLIGRPAEEIVNYAGSLDAAMIVMATHGYSGLKHLVLGSTAEAVLRRAKCPVLSVRSE